MSAVCSLPPPETLWDLVVDVEGKGVKYPFLSENHASEMCEVTFSAWVIYPLCPAEPFTSVYLRIDVPFDNMQINSEPWYIILYPMEAGSTLTGYHKANMVQLNLPQEEAYGSPFCPFN